VPGLDLLLVACFLPLAYGPFPGVELIPYFLGILVWAGLAFAAFLFSPITALLRRLRKRRGAPVGESKSEPTSQSVPESSGEGAHD
jgi:hypothetical protein